MAGRDQRLSRLFNRDENAVVIAADHGFFDGPIPGMIRIEETLEKIDGGVDAVLLSPGIIERRAKVFDYKGAPVAIMPRVESTALGRSETTATTQRRSQCSGGCSCRAWESPADC